MDENAGATPVQNTPPPQGGVSPLSADPNQAVNVNPELPPVPAQSIIQQQVPTQPMQPQTFVSSQQSMQQPVPQQPTAESPKITLQDLYGPSQPHELQQAVNAGVPQVQEPAIPPLSQQPSLSVEPSQNLQPIQTVQVSPSPIPQPQPVVPEVPATPLPSNPPMQPEIQAVPPVVPEEVAPRTEILRESVDQATPTQEQRSPGGGGFHLSSILRFVIGGAILLFVALIVFWVISLFSNKGSEKVTLTYWGLWEDSNVMQPILDDFHKENPNITVTYVKEDPKDYTKRLLTRMQEGNGPDIFRIHNTWVYPLQSVLLPLPTNVIDTKQLQSNYPPTVTKDLVSNGALYALPLQLDTLSLFVNTDIFSHAGASVPTTWDKFITVAKALTVKDPEGHIQTAGASLGTFNNVSHAPDIVSLLLLQNGANLQKLQSSSNVTDALSFYTSFAKPDSSVWDNTLDNSLTAFANGKVAMYFGYSYDILAIQSMNPSLKFSVNPVPHLPGRDITIASYWVEAVSNRSKYQKEALAFMQYLAQKDTQTKLYTEEAKTRPFGELYARLDLADLLKNNQLLGPIVGQFSQAQSSYFVADTNYDEYNGALNQYLANAVNSMLKDTSADSAAATLSQGVSQVLGNFSSKTQ